MTPDNAFGSLLDDSPSEERERLYRIKGELRLRDNDALWDVLKALGYYDRLYREYPARISEEAQRVLIEAQKTFAAEMQMEASRARGTLVEMVAHTSAELAAQMAGRKLRWHGIAAAIAALVLFGGICMAAGASLGSAGGPSWIRPPDGSSIPLRITAGVLGAPAGWMAFALLLPLAVFEAMKSWKVARAPTVSRQERVMAGMATGTYAAGALACVTLLLMVL